MERSFRNIIIDPDDVMRHMLQDGRVLLERYMLWLMSDRSWESVMKVLMEYIINKVNQQ